MDARYIVGIDLGTTNSALAHCESAVEDGPIAVQEVPQLVNPNEVGDRNLLPSFLYIPGEVDFPKGSLALPWEREPRFVVVHLLAVHVYVDLRFIDFHVHVWDVDLHIHIDVQFVSIDVDLNRRRLLLL